MSWSNMRGCHASRIILLVSSGNGDFNDSSVRVGITADILARFTLEGLSEGAGVLSCWGGSQPSFR